MAGLIAAVAAARRGSRVVLIHDRPVLGGNASSEVRMWICGAHHHKETGLLEEMQLCNMARNPAGLYSVWDSVLFQYARMTPGLTTLLNCTCNDAEMAGGKIAAIRAWQMPTQSWHTVWARYFIDASGDSILAPLSGAETRHGRESREEFGEPIAPSRADGKTMGNTVLLQLEETAHPHHFEPPNWAYRFGDDSTLPSRVGEGFGNNFWWLELGGLNNTITDADAIRDDLIKAAWGVWDYMKNRGPQAAKLTNWRLRWLGSLPGKRENRRYLGEHILTQHDIESEGRFEDIVAYGGWSMDDHHPAGLLYPGKATLFHKAPSPYGIPLRSLYSRNVPNLLCAGRNISATHVAMSSTRVMGTCAVMGQAVGLAAALCVRENCLPSEIKGDRLERLQRQLADDDCWLPWKTRVAKPETQSARLSVSDGSADPEVLRDGYERDSSGGSHAWEAPAGGSVTFDWKDPQKIASVRLVFDSDLHDSKRMPVTYPDCQEHFRMPKTLVREFRLEVQRPGGGWEVLVDEKRNTRRLFVADVAGEVTGLRFTGGSSYGDGPIRLFSMEASGEHLPPSLNPPDGISWREKMDAQDPADMAPPDNGLEDTGRGSGRVGA